MHSTPGGELTDLPRIDRWLRFDPDTQAVHDRQMGPERALHIQQVILLGLSFYNIYHLSSYILMPEVFWLGVVLRGVLVTGCSLLLAWVIPRLLPVWRERMVTMALINAYAVPIVIYVNATNPMADFAFTESTLVLVYGNMLMALRFRHAVAFTVAAWIISGIGLIVRDQTAADLMLVLMIQITTSCTFTLIANHKADKRRCADFLARHLATVQAARAMRDLQRMEVMSMTDPLTGLPNRRAWDAALDDAFARGASCAVMMIDIDHFKRFNDTLGHQNGDLCLQTIGGLLQVIAAREGGTAARVGGEEFTLLITGRAELDVVRIANALVRDVAGLAIPHPGRRDGTQVVTVSVGVALRDPRGTDGIADLVGDADAALYAAKRRGRNRFDVATPQMRRSATA